MYDVVVIKIRANFIITAAAVAVTARTDSGHDDDDDDDARNGHDFFFVGFEIRNFREIYSECEIHNANTFTRVVNKEGGLKKLERILSVEKNYFAVRLEIPKIFRKLV